MGKETLTLGNTEIEKKNISAIRILFLEKM